MLQPSQSRRAKAAKVNKATAEMTSSFSLGAGDIEELLEVTPEELTVRHRQNQNTQLKKMQEKRKLQKKKTRALKKIRSEELAVAFADHDGLLKTSENMDPNTERLS